MLEVFDSFGAAPLIAEKNTEPSMVMLGGYVPDDLRIMELILAGERLEAFKTGMPMQNPDFEFEADEEVPDDYDNLDDYMDELEAQELYNQSMQRIKESIDTRKELYSRRLREEAEAKKDKEQVVENNEAQTKEGE